MPIKFRIKTYISLIAMLIWACALPALSAEKGTSEALDKLLIIGDSTDFAPKEKLSPKEVGEDIALLTYVLKTGYGAIKYDKGKAVDAAVEKLDAFARGSESYSSQTLCDAVAAILAEVPDNHLEIYGMMTRCGSRLLRKPIPGVGDNVSKKRPWDVKDISVGKNKVPVISITSLPNREDPSWDGFLKEVESARKTAPAIIFDLRGNGGGDNHVVAKAAGILYGQPFSGAPITVRRLQTSAGMALEANESKHEMVAMRLQGEPVPDYLKESYERSHAAFQKALKGELPPEEIIRPSQKETTFDPKKSYGRPIYFLTDGRCASSCESLLEMFEAYPQVVTVGTHTAGTIHFCPTGTLLLPNSQLSITLSNAYNEYADRRFIEKTGYAPKVQVPEGQDALGFAVKDLEEKIDKIK